MEGKLEYVKHLLSSFGFGQHFLRKTYKSIAQKKIAFDESFDGLVECVTKVSFYQQVTKLNPFYLPRFIAEALVMLV